jgi:hypothetical protein
LITEAIWASGKAPQDIALSASASSDDFARWGSPVGYYELLDGTSPRTGAVPQSTDNPLAPTGGHYWKSAPSGTPAYQRADKIACTLCHDPHNQATGTNDAFFRTETRDGNSATPVTLGNGLKASANSRNHAAGGTGREMCAACHKYADSVASPLRLWGVDLPRPPAGVSEHLAAAVTPCTNCHKHNRITANCEVCHGLNGVVSSGKDGVGGTADDGPNVLTVKVGSSWISVWDGSWWRQTMGGGTGVQQGGHGDPNGKAALLCTDCHDTSLPPGRHLDGVVNKVGDPGFSVDLAVTTPPANTNENTSHLKAAFINASGGGAAVQVNFDAACAACHLAAGVEKHSHYAEEDVPQETDVRFGTHLTVSDGSLITPHLPIDIDLSTLAPPGPPHYAPCVACHNPHGTINTETKTLPASATSNLMLRFPLFKKADFCNVCHN